MAAIELLALNKAIFQVENVPLTAEEIAHTFADAQLLAELTLHRSDYNQLLITNDRKLSCDAYDLNQQQSCKGRKVLVCYITGAVNYSAVTVLVLQQTRWATNLPPQFQKEVPVTQPM